MKSIILISIIALFFSKSKNLNESNLKCSDFKTGKFELVNSENNRKYIIERNTEFQTENTYNLKSGEKISGPKVFKIKWINDCQYNLLIDTIESKYDETDKFINSKGGLNNEILKIENNCATINTSFENMNTEAKICKTK